LHADLSGHLGLIPASDLWLIDWLLGFSSAYLATTRNHLQKQLDSAASVALILLLFIVFLVLLDLYIFHAQT
jgi:hypothetical protein